VVILVVNKKLPLIYHIIYETKKNLLKLINVYIIGVNELIETP